LAIFLLIALCERWFLMRSVSRERLSWAAERTELQNRIQMPEYAARASIIAPMEYRVDPMEKDETNLVGRVIPLRDGQPTDDAS